MSVSRWRVSVDLLVAALSFQVLWFGPLILAAWLGRLYLFLWYGPARGEGAAGLLWSVLIGVIGGACLNGIIIFVRVSLGLRRVRKKLPKGRRWPSGLPVNEGEAPELFALLARVRQRVGLKHPVEVWVDFSAHVAQATYRRPRSAGRLRAVVIGLPLFAALSVEEMELVVAFYAALLALPDPLLRLALWTKSMAIIRYMSPCWRLCAWAFRTANRYASGLASRDGGDAEQAMQALEKAAADFDTFWGAHVHMLLQTGHLIPIMEGFEEHRRAARAEDQPASLAVSLLRSPSAIEGRAMNLIAQANPPMETISWNQAATVLMHSWTSEVEQKADKLRGSTVGEMGDLFGRDAPALGRRLFNEPGRLYDPKQLQDMTGRLLAAALAVALSRAGWKFLYHGPGSALAFGKNGKVFEPFTLVNQLAAGGVKVTEWQAACADDDIAGLHLA